MVQENTYSKRRNVSTKNNDTSIDISTRYPKVQEIRGISTCTRAITRSMNPVNMPRFQKLLLRYAQLKHFFA